MTPNAKNVPISSSSTAGTNGPVTNDAGVLSPENTQGSKSFPEMAFAGVVLGLTAAFFLGLACLWWRRRRNVRLLGQHAYIEEGGNRKTTTSLWSIKESAKGRAVAGRPSIDGLSREGIPSLQKGWDSANVPVWPGGMRFDVSCLCSNALRTAICLPGARDRLALGILGHLPLLYRHLPLRCHQQEPPRAAKYLKHGHRNRSHPGTSLED
jgi:hypothetical protein